VIRRRGAPPLQYCCRDSDPYKAFVHQAFRLVEGTGRYSGFYRYTLQSGIFASCAQNFTQKELRVHLVQFMKNTAHTATFSTSSR